METLPSLVFGGWSALIRLSPGTFKFSSFESFLEFKYISEKKIISNL